MSEHQDDMPRKDGGRATRRAVLRLGAVAVPAVITLKPAFAANSSIMNCEIPIQNWVDGYGNVQAAETQGAYPPPERPYKAEEILTRTRPSINMVNGEQLSEDAFNAHIRYLESKMPNTAQGFTCFASIQTRWAS